MGRRTGLLRPDTHTELLINADFVAAVFDGWSGAAPGLSTSPHVTILDPFVPSFDLDGGVVSAVRDVVSSFAPFSYEVVRLARFPGVLYLAPDPQEPFIGLTEALWQQFPDRPPYNGAFDEIVPHVTLSLGPEPPGLVEHVQRRLPLRGYAEEVWLMMEDPHGDWHVGERFALGRRR